VKSSKGKYSMKNDTNVNPCYGYGMPGHMLKDCHLIQDRRKMKFKTKTNNKKALIATWSDSEMSDSERDEKQVANI